MHFQVRLKLLSAPSPRKTLTVCAPPSAGWWLAFLCLLACFISLPAMAENVPARIQPPDQSAPANGPVPKRPGMFSRTITVDGMVRKYLLRIPAGMDFSKPAPLVLALHGAGMNGAMMIGFSGLTAQADLSKIILLYPNGTGLADTLLTWNSGGIGPVREKPDDVLFLRTLLDEVSGILKVDQDRIFAVGLSNGGMMAYRLAAEMSDRIAAIAAVGGTLAVADPHPGRPVPVIHFHGTADRIVPYAGPAKGNFLRTSFFSVPETIRVWVGLNGCRTGPAVREITDRFQDGTSVRVSTWSGAPSGAEVVLVDVVGGGHTWPGRPPPTSFLGISTKEISANEMIQEFFAKHPMKRKP
ncbi:MAG: family carbohydrate esterase [Verrucomicrobiales bacterium]|nr:family carbohydrate esterase [Verrucomicrobiales bacterium]